MPSKSVVSVNRIVQFLLIAFVLIGIGKWRSYERMQKAAKTAAEADSIRAEAKDQLTGSTREVRVAFHIEEEFAPPLPEHDADAGGSRTVFTLDEFDKGTKTFTRTVTGTPAELAQFKKELAAKKYAAQRLYIIDPSKPGWAYFGKLTIEFPGDSTRTPIVLEDLRAWVIAEEGEAEVQEDGG
jgi:hypothetical protein